jgi:hypothetical protein
MKKVLRTKYLFLIILVTISSCKPIKKLVNSQYKPLSVEDVQMQSLATNLQGIDSLSPNIGIRIGKPILVEFLPKEIDNSVRYMNDPMVEVHEFKSSLNLTKQAIIVNADFVASFHEIQMKITGNLQGYVAISSIKDSIFFPYALKTLKVKNIEFTTEKPDLTNRAIAALIKPVVKNFIDNLNGKFITDTPSIYTGWGQATKIDTSNLFNNDETTITGPNVEINRFVKISSLLVDEDGVSIMLELEKSKQVQDSVAINKIALSSKELTKQYKKYRIKYSQLWVDNFQVYNKETKLALGITKPTIAGIFNDVLSSANLLVSHKINIPATSSNDKMEIDRLKINCGDVRESFSFPDFGYSKSCNYSCTRSAYIGIKPFGKTVKWDDPVCLTARTACKLARETARVTWQASRESARIAHQVYNEGKVAACKIVVEASELVNVGRIKTSSKGNGVASLNLNNIQVNNDLSGMSLNTKGDVKLRLKSTLGLEPQDLGFIAMCVVNYDKSITTDLTGEIFNQFSEISFDPIKVGEDIVLTGTVSPLGYKAETDMSPLHELLIDPEFAVKCSPLYSTLLTAGVLGGAATLLGLVDDPKLQLLLSGRAIDTYEIEPFTQKINPIIFKINNGESRKANVEWGHNSIDYSY